MEKELNQISSQELEELQIKISEELRNRQLSSKSKEIEKIKQELSGKYIKYTTEHSTHVGYVNSVTPGDDGYELAIGYAGFILDAYGSIRLHVNSYFVCFCDIEDAAKVQCITQDEMKKIFKEYLDDLNKCFEDKVLKKIEN